METVFKILLGIVLVFAFLIGAGSVIGGLIMGAWYTVLLGGIALALPLAWYAEEHGKNE